uniref:Malonyl-CoA:ACP transacylase (MAT) domain-containing protein n=1 Tax=uncultured organism MedDCM-OCT-S04-C478 TaxID=743617 RepID=D6PK54_9ZZZZ|nr:hypothetical protein [uncultured organism MedDCM-OCT-S04-C478]
MNWVAMFPGQGSQKAGMGEELLNLYPDLLIDEFEELLAGLLNKPFYKVNKVKLQKQILLSLTYSLFRTVTD